MGEITTIAWTDATLNFWWGCSPVGPGCDFCFARNWDRRCGGDHWGVGVPRRKIDSAPRQIQKLNDEKADAKWRAEHGRPRRVFISSMCDLFDLEVPGSWFAEAWEHVCFCDRLSIQIVTKRLPAIERRLGEFGYASWPQHAGLIATVVTQAEADRDVPRLLTLKEKLGIPWVGLSIEPMLGMINLTRLERRAEHDADWTYLDNALTGFKAHKVGGWTGPKLDWVICGGESKQGKDHQPRPFDLAWARALRDQCAAAGVAFFMKQFGANPTGLWDDGEPSPQHWSLKDRAGADPAEWPDDLRVREFPEQLR